jgi:predicted CopG family antitoxin
MEQLSFAGDVVTKNELEEMKENINDSFSEVVNLHLELRRDLDMLLERLEIHNRRASHKI